MFDNEEEETVVVFLCHVLSSVLIVILIGIVLWISMQ